MLTCAKIFMFRLTSDSKKKFMFYFSKYKQIIYYLDLFRYMKLFRDFFFQFILKIKKDHSFIKDSLIYITEN